MATEKNIMENRPVVTAVGVTAVAAAIASAAQPQYHRQRQQPSWCNLFIILLANVCLSSNPGPSCRFKFPSNTLRPPPIQVLKLSVCIDMYMLNFPRVSPPHPAPPPRSFHPFVHSWWSFLLDIVSVMCFNLFTVVMVRPSTIGSSRTTR